MFTHLKTSFYKGLLFLLPLMLTALLCFLLFRLGYGIFDFTLVFLPAPLRAHPAIRLGVVALTVLVFVFFTTLLGYTLRTLLGRSLHRAAERLFHSLPLVKSFYGAFKQLFELLFPAKPNPAFSATVLIEFPSRGQWVVAFQTGRVPAACAPDAEGEYYSVLIPTTPSPHAGLVVIVPRKDMRLLQINTEQTFKYLLSCGTYTRL